MRKEITLILLSLLTSALTMASNYFTVNSNGDKVVFAPGNLQYQASTNTWRFAEHQWDAIGLDNENISSTYSGWIDLIGWGMTGYNNKYPWITSVNWTDYADGIGANNISNTNYDWGIYCYLDDCTYDWRTPRGDELNYILNLRDNAEYLRGVALVNGVCGLVLLPDNSPIVLNIYEEGISLVDNKSYFAINTYSESQWENMEKEGAVFFPCNGFRVQEYVDRTRVDYYKYVGYYWTSTIHSIYGDAECLLFNGTGAWMGANIRYTGYNVRLIRSYVPDTDVAIQSNFSASICQGGSFTWDGTTYYAAGDYVKRFKSVLGCDSTVTLHLTVAKKYNHSFNVTICQGSTYTWDGSTYNTTGNYTKHFQSVAGCDSTVTLHLTVAKKFNHSFNVTICQGNTYTWEGTTYSTTGDYTKHLQSVAGCDSTVTLHLFVAPKYTHSFNDTICQGETYTWEGSTYRTTGNYKKYLKSVSGCDSTVTLNLYVAPKYTHSFRDTICQGETYTWEGSTYSTTGNYTKHLLSVSGCDSTVTLHLTVAQKYNHSFNATICKGSTYTWEGSTYSAAGNYTKHLQSVSGCDSTVTLHLTVAQKYNHSFNATICKGSTYTWEGTTYSAAGNYTKHFQSVAGCDSTVTLHLSVGQKYDYSFHDTICQGSSYRWEGSIYSTTGNYTKHLQSKAGCDSTVTLHLFVAPKYTHSFRDTICEGSTYAWEGSTYRATGNYKKYLKSVAGCDSIVTLNLYVAPKYTHSFRDTICEGSSYTWEGTTYTTKGNYTKHLQSVTGCDSTVTLRLHVAPKYAHAFYAKFCEGNSYTWKGTEYSAAGNYTKHFQSVAGCDSTVTMHLTKMESTDSIEVVTICAGATHTWHGQTFSSSITTTETITNAAGCDSVCTLKLTVLPALIGDTSATFCNGTSFKWHGVDYSIAGDYPYTYTSKVTGCDSIVTLHLTQLEPTDSVEIVKICAGESHTWHGKTFSSSITTTETITNAAGCDSVCTLKLTVLPALTGDTSATFCKGHPFIWHGTPYAIDGNYPYTYTSKVAPYCDSIVTLHLTQLEPTDSVEIVTICTGTSYTWHGQTFTSSITTTETITNADGCDSVCALQLTVLPTLIGDTSATFCNGHPFNWHGVDYAVGGDYPYTYTSKVTGCDSIVTLYLTQLEPTDSVEIATICAGDTYTWHGQTFTSSITTTETITNAAGCDSVCTLQITVLPALTGDTSATFCNGTPFMWHGTPYTSGGDYLYTYTSKVTGCDSIVTLHLTQLEPTDSIEVVTICAGTSHTWLGQTFTTSTTITETIPNFVGCDSTCTLRLTVLPALTGDTTATFCNGTPFMWHGTPYTSGGDYPYTYTSKVAPYCDSIVTLHLSQLEPSDSIEYATICEGESHIWHGDPYTSTTDITEIITNAAGCDSVCTLHLKVNPKLSGDTTASVCDGGTFTWWENTYSTKGDYARTFQSQVTGCDSIVTLHLNILPPLTTTLNESITEGATYIWNGVTYSEKGVYTQSFITAEGCDSIVTLNLTVNPLVYDILAHIQCADDPYLEFEVTASDGLFHQLQFVFTPKAIAQHFRDTIVDYSASQILIPNSARAGIYGVAVSPLFNNQMLDTRNIQFTLLYPSSVLDQHWDDFIGVLTHNYNGGYDFVSFQWYKNGQPMAGENHSYTYQPLEMGSAYSAMLEEADGTKLMTCEIIATPQTEISLYPTLLQPHQIIRLYNSEPVTIWIYDTLGRMIFTNAFEKGENHFDAPQNQGMYIIKIQQTGKQEKTSTKKLIVR